MSERGGPLPRIRPYDDGDLAAVYEICLLTGDSGRDASGLYDDPEALGHLYAGPYVTLEPDLAFVLEDADGVCGYVLGALDTREFNRALVERWLPPLQARIPCPQGDPTRWTRTQRMHHRLHHPDLEFPEILEPYPSHLHIDLLERAQGRGQGRRLLERLFDALVSRGSPGVHLGVGTSNVRAQGFYRRMGFTELRRDPGSVLMARSLP